ncbi:hypothetical protein BGZ89_006919, partial [Linnemannia elongata]
YKTGTAIFLYEQLKTHIEYTWPPDDILDGMLFAMYLNPACATSTIWDLDNPRQVAERDAQIAAEEAAASLADLTLGVAQDSRPDIARLPFKLSLELLEKLPVEEYKSITTALKERIPGPAITTWLAWYQDPCRESLIFPAMTSADTSRLVKDTNAQEGLGSAYKQTLPTDRKMTIMEAVTHCYYYMERFEGDDKLVSKGHSLSYGSKDKPVPKYVDPKYHNDGEPNLRSVPNKPERSSSFSGQDDYLSAPFSHDETSSSQAQSSSPTFQDQDDLSFSSFSQDKSSSAQSSSSISLAQSSPYRVFNQGAKKKHARGANRFPKVDKSYWDNLGIPWGIDYSHEMMVEDKDGNKSF